MSLSGQIDALAARVRDEFLAHSHRLQRFKATASLTSTSSTLANITGMTASVVSGESYMFHILWVARTAGTGNGIRGGFSHPGGSGHWNYRGPQAVPGSTSAFWNSYDTLANSQSTNLAQATATDYLFEGVGTYDCTASGTFQVQGASEAGGTQVVFQTQCRGYLMRTS